MAKKGRSKRPNINIKGEIIMADKKYAISASAVRSDGRGNLNGANGVNVIYAPDDEIAKRAAMEFATKNFKPSDGFVGHLVSAMEVPADEVKQKKWFMP